MAAQAVVRNDFRKLEVFADLLREMLRARGLKPSGKFVQNPAFSSVDTFCHGFGYHLQSGKAYPNKNSDDVKRVFELTARLGSLDQVSEAIRKERGIHLDTSQLLRVLADTVYVNGSRPGVKLARTDFTFLKSRRLFEAVQELTKSHRCIKMSKTSHPLDRFVRSLTGYDFEKHEDGYATRRSKNEFARPILSIDYFHNRFIDYLAVNFSKQNLPTVLSWFAAIATEANTLAELRLAKLSSVESASEYTDQILCLKFFVDRDMFVQFAEYFYTRVQDKWGYGHYDLKREIQFLTFPFKLLYGTAQQGFYHKFHFYHIDV